MKDLGRPRSGMGDLLSFLLGTPALDVFPLAQRRRYMGYGQRRISPGRMDYGPAEGSMALRQAVAEYLRVSRGVRCDTTQVFITDGTQNSPDMYARTLTDVGDTAWIENPNCYGARTVLQAADMRLMSISVGVDGLAPREEGWHDMPLRLAYIAPSYQYPPGVMMSLERRLSLIQHACVTDAWIIRGSCDSELRHMGAPLSVVQGLTENAPVIYLGTFSKTLLLTLRLGYMVIPPALASMLKKAAGALMLCGRVTKQLVLAELTEAGYFTRHLKHTCHLYDERHGASQAATERYPGGIVTVSGGAEGTHLPARFDAPVLDTEVSCAVRARGMALWPLSYFCLPGTLTAQYNGLVLGHSNVPAEAMDGSVKRMWDVIKSVGG